MFEIQERRANNGRLLKLVLIDRQKSDQPYGPSYIERLLHAERTPKGWNVHSSGPLGGARDDTEFSPNGLRAFFNRLLAEL